MNKVAHVFRYTFLLLSIVTGPVSLAQKTIHGFVKNAETGKALPTTNIWVEGTYRGTTSNYDGEYTLQLKTLPATVVVRYIGYESERTVVTESSPSRLDFLLKPIVLEMPPVVVTGGDPAVAIMREVIRRKQEWRKKLDTYRAEAYTRLGLENDTSIVFIVESTSELYWDHKRGQREIIKSKRETSNISDTPMIISASYLPNFYDDDVEIMGNRVIGPTHPDALDHYVFTLQGRRVRDDKAVFDIAVTPKSKLQPCFTGRVTILDQDYAMIEADLRPSEAVLMPFPIQDWNVYHKQQFSNFGQEFWLPVDVRMNGDIKVGMTGLQFPTIKYSQLSRFVNYQVNVPLPDSLYEKKSVITVDSLAVKQDTLLASESRVIPLTDRESEAYTTIDSTMTIEKAFRPTGFLTRFAKFDVSTSETEEQQSEQNEASGESAHSKKRGWKDLLSGLSPQARFNRVDALHLGLDYQKTLYKRLTLNIGGAYKTGLKRWSFRGGLKCQIRKRSNTLVSVGYQRDTNRRYDSDSYPTSFNTFFNLFGNDDYFDYYWNEGISVEVGHRLRRMQTQLSLGFRNENHTSVGKTTDYDLLGRDYAQRTNPVIDEGRLRSVTFGATFGEEYVPWGIVGQRHAEFKLEHSSPDILSSDFSFTRYAMTIDWRIATFLRRRFLPNVLDIRLVGSTSTGDLPIQRFSTLDGRLAALTPFGVFKSLGDRPYEGEHCFAVFWEHNFRTVPFEMLGLRSLVKRGLGVVVHGAVGRTWISDSRRDLLEYDFQYIDGWHQELGLSLNGLFGLLRIDATKRLDRRGFSVGISMARMF